MTGNHVNAFEPARFLIENIDLLPRGRVFDIALGSGRNAIHLSRLGFDVEGVDILPEVLKSAKEGGVTVQVQVAHLEGNYYIKKDAYDVIIFFNYLRRSLISQIKDGL